MPLIREIPVDPGIHADTRRYKEFYITGDYMRRINMGKEVSIRMSKVGTMEMLLINSLREVAEPEVQVDAGTLEAYDNAQDHLCAEVTNIFKKVSSLGMRPTDIDPEAKISVLIGTESSGLLTAGKLIWIPAVALWINMERYCLFRVVTPSFLKQVMDAGDQLTVENTGCIGYTMEALKCLSPQLTDYVNRLESKARTSPAVEAAFARLAGFLRPEQARAERQLEMEQQYGGSFGQWG